MTGEGTVTSVSHNTATVLICKSSACSHNCSDCSACSNSSYETEVLNPIGAKCGDRVLIEAGTRTVLGISLLVYMLPVFFMIAAAAFCDAFSLSRLYTVLLFALLISLWIGIIRLVNFKTKAQSSIIRVLTDSKD